MASRFSTFVAAGLIAATSLTLTSCGSDSGEAGDGKLYSKVKENDKTDMDKNKDKEVKEASKLEDDEIKREAQEAIDRFFKIEYSPERLEDIKNLDEQDYELLQKIAKSDSFFALDDKDKEKVVKIADNVYKIQDVYAHTTTLSEEDLANLIVGLNSSIDLLFRSGIQNTVEAEVDDSKAQISEDKLTVTFPKDSFMLNVDGQKNPSQDDVTVVFEGGTYKITPDTMIEMGKMVSQAPQDFSGKLFEEDNSSPDDIKAEQADR